MTTINGRCIKLTAGAACGDANPPLCSGLNWTHSGAIHHSGFLRVAVVESHDVYRAGLVGLLGVAEGIRSVGSWSAPAEAAAHLTMMTPDVVLVDAAVVEADDGRLTDALRSIRHHAAILTLSDCPANECENNHEKSVGHQEDSDTRLSNSLTARSNNGYCERCRYLAKTAYADQMLRKQTPFEQILQSIRLLHAEHMARTHLAAQPQSRVAHCSEINSPDLQRWNGFSPREAQIVCLVRRGCSNKEIAAEMDIAYSTVKNYMSSILDKLDLENRTQLAIYAASALQPAG